MAMTPLGPAGSKWTDLVERARARPPATPSGAPADRSGWPWRCCSWRRRRCVDGASARRSHGLRPDRRIRLDPRSSACCRCVARRQPVAARRPRHAGARPRPARRWSQVLLAPAPLFLLAALLVIVATTTYLVGRWVGAIAGLAGMAVLGVVSAASDEADDHAVDGFTTAVYPALLLVVAFLLDVVATDRWKASAGLVRLHEKSDAILTGVGEAVVVTGPTAASSSGTGPRPTRSAATADEARGQAVRRGARAAAPGPRARLLAGLRPARPRRRGERVDGVPVDVEVWRQVADRHPPAAAGLGVAGRSTRTARSSRSCTASATSPGSSRPTRPRPCSSPPPPTS